LWPISVLRHTIYGYGKVAAGMFAGQSQTADNYDCSFWHGLTKARRLAYFCQLDALKDLFIAKGEEKVNRPPEMAIPFLLESSSDRIRHLMHQLRNA